MGMFWFHTLTSTLQTLGSKFIGLFHHGNDNERHQQWQENNQHQPERRQRLRRPMSLRISRRSRNSMSVSTFNNIKGLEKRRSSQSLNLKPDENLDQNKFEKNFNLNSDLNLNPEKFEFKMKCTNVELEFLEDAFSCPVCLEDFQKVPKILPTCGHSFCLPCLEHWYEFSGASDTGILRCPTCKTKTNLRFLQGGLSLFPKKSSIFGTKSLPPPPPKSALRKLLADSPTIATILKLQKRMKNLTNPSTSTSKFISIIENNTEFKSLLICRACNCRLEEPRMLPACRHSVCATCLQKIYKSNEKENSIKNENSSPTQSRSLSDSATILCPVCDTLYRFNFHKIVSASTASPITTTTSKSSLTENKLINSNKKAHLHENLATYLPFDYVLSCLLDAVPEKM